MAVDFQIVFPQQVIPVTSVRSASSVTVPTIDVTGEDFTSVDSVTVNGLDAPSWHVVSRSRMLITLPEGMSASEVSSVGVISTQFVLTEKSYLKFRVSRTPGKVSGILRLVQLFVKMLFTTPGTDAFNKSLGGGALRNVGSTFSKNGTGAVVSDFVVAADNVARQIITLQSKQPLIPPSEKLLGMQVTKATFSKQESALVVTIELTSQAGNSTTASLVI